MAIPNPERELARLEAETRQGLPPCVVLLGPSAFFRARAFDLALGKVGPKAELKIQDGTQKSEGKELGLLRGGGLFARAACLAVRRAEDWLLAYGDALLAFVPKIAKGTTLIIEAQKLDGRTKLGKLLAEAGARYEFRDLYAEPYDARSSPLETELVVWLVQKSKTKRTPLSPEAAFTMISVVGKDPQELLAELDRLVHVVGERATPLGPDDLRGKLNASLESTPFEFAEALLARDRRRAQRALAAMFARGVRDRDGGTIDQGGVFPFVTSWLQQAITQAMVGRRLLDSGVPLRDVPAQAGVRVFQDRFSRQVQRNDMKALETMLDELMRAQRELRLVGEEPELLLERLVARCLATAGATAGARAEAGAGTNAEAGPR